MANIHSPSAHVAVKVGCHNLTANGNSTAIDCRGYTRAQFVLVATTAAASTVVAALQECATAGGSYVAVSGGGFTNVAASQTNQLQLMDVDLNKRLEFLEVAFTVTGTVGVDLIVNLYNGEGLPQTTTQIVV